MMSSRASGQDGDGTLASVLVRSRRNIPPGARVHDDVTNPPHDLGHTNSRTWTGADGPAPALYLGHGAPPLLDDELWTSQLATWAKDLPKPTAILIVSAHWESAPLTLGATEAGVPLTYDFYGFPERFYRMTYRSPGAP
jgi:hypothetical protein